MKYSDWPTSLITPIMPPEGQRTLEDLVFELVASASHFSSALHPTVRTAIGELVRSMNCYYSNLIEGHATNPLDIERALKSDFSKEPKKRNLQLEARAHIETQRMIDDGSLVGDPHSVDFIVRVHREFLSRLPPELLVVRDAESEAETRVVPGELRSGWVKIGEHVPPPASELPAFLAHFERCYAGAALSKTARVLAIPCAHHRFLWIHPFYDGNGRVARLIDHASFRALALGDSLWTPSRGLARNVADYKMRLMNADQQRRGDLDGRGNLSLSALIEFCEFYLTHCLDQVRFMHETIEPGKLLRRIERYVEDRRAAGELPHGSFLLLQHALVHGEFERGEAARITGYKDRQARSVLSALVAQELLTSARPKGPVRLAFPMKVVNDWFPRLFPAE